MSLYVTVIEMQIQPFKTFICLSWKIFSPKNPYKRPEEVRVAIILQEHFFVEEVRQKVSVVVVFYDSRLNINS